MKPKVVIFSAFLSPFRSGAEACAEEVALALSDRYEITIITARLRSSLSRFSFLVQNEKPETRNQKPNVRIIRVGFGHPIDKWLYPILAPFVARKLKPEIIHAILESFAGIAMVFSKWIIPSAKRILTCQSTNTRMLLEGMHRAAHTITCISSVLLARAQSFNRFDAVLIPNGVHVQAIHDAAAGMQRVKGRILFVGRLEPMKGIDTLLEAFAIVHKGDTKPTLRIVGGGSLRDNLWGQVQELGLTGYVEFEGYVSAPQLYQEYAQAEIFCGLSRSEALGNVFLEAQAAECAVIATNVGGIPDIVKHGETGLLVPPNDPAAAAEQIRTLLRDGSLRNELTRRAKENAAKYDWKGIVEQYAEVYRTL